MKTFWKTHPALRSMLMILRLVPCIGRPAPGGNMTAQLPGLGLPLVGVALLLAVLAIYNATYQD